MNTGPVGLMLSEAAKTKLRARCDAPEDAELTYKRAGKWIVYITVSVGLCQYGKFRFDCRRGIMQET